MAFGKTATAAVEKKTNSDGTAQTFPMWPFVNCGNGYRLFRILPELDGGTVKRVPVLDALDRPVKGKMTTEAETEVRWLEAWWPVVIDGKQRKARFMLDLNDRWGNPIWKYIKKNHQKGDQEWGAMKERFGVNVVDLTTVVKNEKGYIIYPNLKGEYVIPAYGKVLDEAVEGEPMQLNQVRIFENSAGQEGGKHMFEQFMNLADGLQNPKGESIGLHQVTLRVKTQGVEKKTTRSLSNTTDYTELPDELVLAPRYNIREWCQPWPYEMIERAMAFEDFNSLVEEYNIVLLPQLYDVTTEETPVSAPVKRNTKKAAVVEEEPELFEE